MTEQNRNKHAPKDTQYLFISAFLRAKEAKLLTGEKAERLLTASPQEVARILDSCGYPDVSAVGLEAALNRRRKEAFDEIASLLPGDAAAELFRLRYDYHNAKVIVKAQALGIEADALFNDAGRTDPKALKQAFEADGGAASSVLPGAMKEAASVLARSADAQQAELILDRAYFEEYHALARRSGSEFLMGFASLQADSANLRTAVRARRLGKDAAFLQTALVCGGSVSSQALCEAAQKNKPFAPLFAGTLLYAAAQEAQEAQNEHLTTFERLCDDAQTAYLTAAKSAVFGQAVVIAWLYALETEIQTVRMIISGRQNGLSAEELRPRLRKLYW